MERPPHILSPYTSSPDPTLLPPPEVLAEFGSPTAVPTLGSQENYEDGLANHLPNCPLCTSIPK